MLATLGAIAPESRTDSLEVKEEVRKALRRYFSKTLDRRPVVVAVRHGDVTWRASRAEAAREARGARAERRATKSRLLDDVAAVVSLTAAALSCCSASSPTSATLPNLNFAGRVGHGLADVAVQALGYAAYLLPLVPGRRRGGCCSASRPSELSGSRAASPRLLLLLCVAVLLGSRAAAAAAAGRPLAGGWFGGFLAAVLAQGVRHARHVRDRRRHGAAVVRLRHARLAEQRRRRAPRAASAARCAARQHGAPPRRAGREPLVRTRTRRT